MKMKILNLLITAFVVLTGCDKDNDHCHCDECMHGITTIAFKVSGKVTNQEGVLLSGITLSHTACEQTYTTESTGEYSFVCYAHPSVTVISHIMAKDENGVYESDTLDLRIKMPDAVTKDTVFLANQDICLVRR